MNFCPNYLVSILEFLAISIAFMFSVNHIPSGSSKGILNTCVSQVKQNSRLLQQVVI